MFLCLLPRSYNIFYLFRLLNLLVKSTSIICPSFLVISVFHKHGSFLWGGLPLCFSFHWLFGLENSLSLSSNSSRLKMIRRYETYEMTLSCLFCLDIQVLPQGMIWLFWMLLPNFRDSCRSLLSQNPPYLVTETIKKHPLKEFLETHLFWSSWLRASRLYTSQFQRLVEAGLYVIIGRVVGLCNTFVNKAFSLMAAFALGVFVFGHTLTNIQLAFDFNHYSLCFATFQFDINLNRYNPDLIKIIWYMSISTLIKNPAFKFITCSSWQTREDVNPSLTVMLYDHRTTVYQQQRQPCQVQNYP